MATIETQNNTIINSTTTTTTTTTHHGEEHKRVSFGGEKQIVYDDGLAEDCTLNDAHAPYLQQNAKHNLSFTDSNAPPSKVTVRGETSEVPRPISPPAQLNARADLAADARTSAAKNGNASFIALSPALPSFIKKMENESNENPFRPEESLYHEVDPIVEAYRQRPFPPSPTGSPIPPSTATGANSVYETPARHTKRQPEFGEVYVNDVTKGGGSYYERVTTVTSTTRSALDGGTPNTSVITTTTVVNNSGGEDAKRNDSGGGGVLASRTASLAEGRRSKSDGPEDYASALLVADGGSALLPPHKAELVHVDEKKRKCCACCSLQ